MTSTVTLTPDGLKRWGIASVAPAGSTAAVAGTAPPPAGSPVPPGAGDRVNGLSFSGNGRFLVSSHDNGTLQLFSGEAGGREAVFASRDYGCRLVTHTHHELGVLHASHARADSWVGQVAYHSLHDNKVVRFFRAHAAPVSSISMHPRSDWFLTTSRDATFRLWDLRQPNCAAVGGLGAGAAAAAAAPPSARALLPGLPGDPVGAFDLSGRVFAVATPERTLALYDPAVFSRGPFATTELPLLAATVRGAAGADARFPAAVSWTALEFSPDDRFIAVASADRGVLIVDAFAPQRELALLASHPIDASRPSNASFSPCGRFLAVGGADGHVWAYDLEGEAGVFGGAPGEGRIQLGKLAEDDAVLSALGPLPYEAGRWDPPAVLIGEAYKSASAAAAAHAGASEYSARLRAAQSATGGTAASALPHAPFAAAPEEQVSRHEAAVGVVRFHPRAAVLASAAASVAWWLSPPP